MPCTVEVIPRDGDPDANDVLNSSSSSSVNDQVDSLLNLPEQHSFSKTNENNLSSNFNSRNQSHSTWNQSNGKSSNEIDSLPGEKLEKYDDVICDCDLYISTYRIVLISKNKEGSAIIPILSLDNVESRDNVCLQLNSKDGKIIRLKTTTNEAACALYKKFTQISAGKRKMCQDIYAYIFRQEVACLHVPHWIKEDAGKIKSGNQVLCDLKAEFKHLGYDENKWRITEANDQFKLCRTYPQYLVVPKAVSDEELKRVHNGRFFSRFPVAVWRCKSSGAVLLRSAQPTISWLGAANEDDLRYIDTVYNSVPCSSGEKKQKLLILDARSYTAAWANRAKGGGFEGSDTYINSDIEFMSLPNIHNVRYSFMQLRNVAHSTDDATFLTNLHNSQWFQCIGTLIKTAMRCSEALFAGRSVLVHCSDGWDRTAQIVTLCKVLSDPYYRTFDGFKFLVERDWIGFGHKFADRNGVLNEDPNERSPIFLQWLDCVHQLWHQNPKEFEFNQRYLMKLAQHSYSGLFGTFLFNSVADANADDYHVVQPGDNYEVHSVNLNAVDVWDYLNKENQQFVNVVYKAKLPVLNCKAGIPYLRLWSEVYRCTEAENIINNVVDDNYSLQTISFVGQVDPDRISNISRSQSVTSLVSMNDAHGPTHTTSYPMPIHSVMSGSPHSNSFVANMSRCSQDSNGISSCKENIDLDGLNKVSIEPEDSVFLMVSKLRKKEKGLNKMNSANVCVDIPLIDENVTNQICRPTTNGVIYNNSHLQRMNGFTNGSETTTCADTENLPNCNGERISVK